MEKLNINIINANGDIADNNVVIVAKKINEIVDWIKEHEAWHEWFGSKVEKTKDPEMLLRKITYISDKVMGVIDLREKTNWTDRLVRVTWFLEELRKDLINYTK